MVKKKGYLSLFFKAYIKYAIFYFSNYLFSFSVPKIKKANE